MEKHEHYTYRITWSAEEREYVGLCAEFPSLSWLAATRTGALEGIEKVVSETIADMLTQAKRAAGAGGKELQRKTGVAHDAGTTSPAGDRRDGGRREPEPLSVRTPGGVKVQGRRRAALCRRQAKRCFAAAIAVATCCGATPPLAARLSRQDCNARIG